MAHHRLIARVLPVLLPLAVAACATTQMSAEWANKAYAGKSLKGERILIVCQGPDPTVQRLCEDELATNVNSRGATAVRPGVGASTAASETGPLPPSAYLDAARAAGASAVLSMTLQPDSTVVNPGPVVGIGVGGGGFSGGGWGRGGGSFGGVGTSVGIPVGGGSVQTGFAASTTIVDTGNGEVVWSGRAVSPPSDAFIRQLIDLNRVTFQAIQKAGVL
jgi:hypothetical protein